MEGHERTVYVFLADGFEEIEALTVVDILRRCKIPVVMTSIGDDIVVTSSHQVRVVADNLFAEALYGKDVIRESDVLVLPGGMPGTSALAECGPLGETLVAHDRAGGKIAAICAAPTVLSALGLLKDKAATSYPARLAELDCREKSEEAVVVDGNVTTSRGMGTAIDFALALVEELISPEKAREVAGSIVYVR